MSSNEPTPPPADAPKPSPPEADGAAAAPDLPEIEDAYTPDAVDAGSVAEDDPQLLDSAARSLEAAGPTAVENGEVAPAAEAIQRVQKDDTSDTDVADSDVTPPSPEKREPAGTNWEREVSTRAIMVALKRVEHEVRQLLEDRDPRRKRKLSGTRRWRDLEEDILAWRFGGRIDEDRLNQLSCLVARRHYLFRRLRFVAGTRPTWNT